MAKSKKTGHGIYVIAAIVLVVAVVIMLYSSGKFGQAVFAKDRTQGWSCYFDYPAGTTREQMRENSCEGWNSRCSGIEKCDANVRKKEGETFRVTSTCEGTHNIRIDGKHRQLHFQCTPVDMAQVKIPKQTAQCSNYKATSQELKNKITEARQKIDKLTEQITTYEKMLNENEQKAAVACALPECVNDADCGPGLLCWEGKCAKVDIEKPSTEIKLTDKDYLPLFQCRRTVLGFHDYYQRNQYPCPEGETLSLLGRVIGKAGVTGTAELWSCKVRNNGGENVLRLNGCNAGEDLDVKVGYAFTAPRNDLGTIPLNLCIYDAKGEHTVSLGECQAGRKEGTIYILPGCIDSDGGKDPLKVGEIYGFSTYTQVPPYSRFSTQPTWQKLTMGQNIQPGNTDVCSGVTKLNEKYCDPAGGVNDPEAFAYGVSTERISCELVIAPYGTCKQGKCVEERPTPTGVPLR